VTPLPRYVTAALQNGIHTLWRRIMSKSQKFVVVGGGLAGASAAEALRREGFDGRLRLIGAESHRPYIRPPLSKDYLSGKDGLDSAYVHPQAWYAENGVDLTTGERVIGLDAEAHRLALSSGESVGYDRLVLATGSSPRVLKVPGADLAGVYYLRTIDDAQALRAAIKDGGKRVVLVGSGWIGMEVAATARTLGNEVTVLEHGAIPLASALGDELGRMFADLHEQNGVVLRTAVEVASIVGTDGRVSGVMLDGGEPVPADLVVIGVGAVPNVELAASAGLDVENGILVDASLQTSDPDIFAAGDVANAYHPVIKQRLRSEHWANALNSGAAVAKSMLGQQLRYDQIPYFYTDQFDLGMEYSGYGPLTKDAELVYRGDRAKREFIVFWLTEGRVVAGMNVNVWDVNDAVQAIIRSGRAVDLAKLADERIPLDSL
jgi:3-phenylpropionate/trans-cinnamate dioxygenase ferredoxin reductase subunit